MLCIVVTVSFTVPEESDRPSCITGVLKVAVVSQNWVVTC